ncbi:MAG TPA: hypothetical protein VJ246_02980 [Patescibacteria group bacterium]|nr:hypothetical protein [Patescibacteria group bacterium]
MQLSERFVYTVATIRSILFRVEHAKEAHHSELAKKMSGLNGQAEAVVYQALHQAFPKDDADEEDNSHFGDLEEIVDRIVREAREDGAVAVDRAKTSVLTDLVETPKQVADFVLTLKEHGTGWLPKEFVSMGKYVIAAIILIGLSNDPLRGIFLATLAPRVQEQHLPIAGILYGAAYVAVVGTELLRLQKGEPFVANPYVTLSALKLRPLTAVSVVRLYNSLYDLAIIHGVNLSDSHELRLLLVPYVLFSSVWMFGEAGLNVLFELLNAQKKRDIKRAYIQGVRFARAVYANTPLPHPAWKKTIGVRRPPTD